MIEQWRIVSPSESVDAAQDASDCDTTDLDVAGLIGTIRPDGFSYFEEGGTLIVVHEVSEGRIDATFDTTYVEINESRPVFELRDDADYNGPVLRVTPADDSFFVDVVDHVRCSSGATDVGSPPAGYFSPSSAWKNS